MTFSEIFKNSFLNGYQSQHITTSYVILTLIITAVIASYIFIIYRLTCKKVFYSLNFNISLIATALITATIIFTIQSSVVISLGMVGALSIIRFRTAIKDPLDLVFLFWSISVGIVCGAGFAEFAIILSVILTVVLVVLSKTKEIRHSQIIVVNGEASVNNKEVIELIKKNSKKFKRKSEKYSANSWTLVAEAFIEEDCDIAKNITAIAGVSSVSVMSHDGEFTY